MVLIQHLLVACLVIGIPTWDYFETKRLKASNNPKAKVQSYQMGIAVMWLLTLVVFLITPDKTALFRLPNSLNFEGELASFIKGLSGPVIVGLVIGSILPIILLRFKPNRSNFYQKQFESLDFFLPSTREQRWWFVLVSLTAGFCEEIIYRAFLYRYFSESPWVLAFWISIILACLIFGIAHGYQGFVGITSTFFLAFFMFVLWYAFGSLWVPILVHVLFDLRILLFPNLTGNQVIET